MAEELVQDPPGTVADLGKKVKAKYPEYANLPDEEVGRKVKAKYPGAYDGFTDLPGKPAAPPPQVPIEGGGGALPTSLDEQSVPSQPPIAREGETVKPPSGVDRGVLFRNYWNAEGQARDLNEQFRQAQENAASIEGLSGLRSKQEAEIGRLASLQSTYAKAARSSKGVFDRELDATVKEVAEAIPMTMDKEGIEYADPTKIMGVAKAVAAKHGIQDPEFEKLVYDRLLAHVDTGIIEKDAERRFEEKAKPVMDAEQLRMKGLFKTDSIEYAKAKSFIDASVASANAGAKQEVDALSAASKQQADAINASLDQAGKQYEQQAAQIQRAAASGAMPPEQAQQQLDALYQGYQEQHGKAQEAISGLNAKSASDVRSINQRYNRRFQEEQRRILEGAERRIDAAAEKFAKEYGSTPEGMAARDRLREIQGEAWTEAAEARGKKIEAVADARFMKQTLYGNVLGAMGARFGESVVEGLGGAFKGIASNIGDQNLYLFGEEMHRAFVLPETKSDSFADLLDAQNLAQSTGQLVGGMLPSLAASTAAAAATGGASVPIQMLAAGAAGWSAETLDISGRVRDDVYRNTGSRERADDAAWKSFVGQVQLLPAYSFEGLPFVGKALNFIPTKGLRMGVAAGTEYGTELLQEIPQSIAEQNILHGKDAYEDFWQGLSSMKESGELKKLLVTMAPISLLGAGGQITSKGAKQALEDGVKAYVAKADLAKYVEGASGQWINRMIADRGQNFSSAVISAMQESAQIDEATATELLKQQEQVIQARDESSRIGLGKKDTDIYTALSLQMNALRAQAEAEQSPAAKAVAEKRAKEIERSLTDFANEGKRQYVEVGFADGKSLLMDRGAAMRALKDPRNIVQAAMQGDALSIDFQGDGMENLVADFQGSVMNVVDAIGAMQERVNSDEVVEEEEDGGEVRTTLEDAAALPPQIPIADDVDSEVRDEMIRARESMGVRYDPLDDLPEKVTRMFDRIEGDKPVDAFDLDEVSDWLYAKYKEVVKMRADPKRMLTIEQIDSYAESLGEAITTVENYKTKLKEDATAEPKKAKPEGAPAPVAVAEEPPRKRKRPKNKRQPRIKINGEEVTTGEETVEGAVTPEAVTEQPTVVEDVSTDAASGTATEVLEPSDVGPPVEPAGPGEVVAGRDPEVQAPPPVQPEVPPSVPVQEREVEPVSKKVFKEEQDANRKRILDSARETPAEALGPRGAVLRYFASGGRVDRLSAMKETGMSHTDMQGKRWMWMPPKKQKGAAAPNVDRIAHDIWQSTYNNENDGIDIQAVRDAVIDVLSGARTKGEAFDELASLVPATLDEKIAEQERDYLERIAPAQDVAEWTGHSADELAAEYEQSYAEWQGMSDDQKQAIFDELDAAQAAVTEEEEEAPVQGEVGDSVPVSKKADSSQDPEAERLQAELDAARKARDKFVADWNDRGQALFAPEVGMAQQTIDGGFDNSQENFDAKDEVLRQRVLKAQDALVAHVDKKIARAEAAAKQTSIETPSSTPVGNAKTVMVDGKERTVFNSNGKPIHPTIEGVQNFWKWFGDSKVVDAQGRPLVVYHATNKDFDAFVTDREHGWGAAYFSVDPNYASSLVGRKKGKENLSVVAAYLRIEDLLDLVELYDAGIDKGLHTSILSRILMYGDVFDEIGLAVESLQKYNRVIEPDVRKALLVTFEGEYGGVRGYEEGFVHDKVVSFAVRNPSQIKSATGNSGAFDTTSASLADRIDQAADELEKKLRGMAGSFPVPPTILVSAMRAAAKVIRAGESLAKAIRAAIDDMQASKWWKALSPSDQGKAEREVREQLRVALQPREPKGPKPSQVKKAVQQNTGVKPEKKVVEVDVSAALRDQIRLEMRAAAEGGKEVAKKVAAVMDKYKTKLSPAQVTALTRAAARAYTPAGARRFAEYADKIIGNSEFAAKVKEVRDLTKRIKKMLRGKADERRDAMVNDLAGRFARINIDNVDIDEHLEKAQRLFETLSMPKAKSTPEVVTAKDTETNITNAELESYVKQQEAVERAAAEREAIEEYEALRESMGIENADLTPDELKVIIDAMTGAKEQAEAAERLTQMREKVKMLRTMARIKMEELARYRKLREAEEDITFSVEQKKMLDDLKEIDVDRLSGDEAAFLITAVNNIVVNDRWGGVRDFAAKGRAERGINDATEALVPLKRIGRPGNEQKDFKIFNLTDTNEMLAEKIARGPTAAAKFMQAIGMHDWLASISSAKRELDSVVRRRNEAAKKLGFRQHIDDSVLNRYKMGFYAYLIQHKGGSAEDMQAQFDKRAENVRESVRRMENPNKFEQFNRNAALYIQAANDVLGDAKSIEELNISPKLRGMVEHQIGEYQLGRENTFNAAEYDHNKIPDAYSNYTRQRSMAVTDEAKADEQKDLFEAPMWGNRLIDSRPSSSKMDRSDMLLPGHAINADFFSVQDQSLFETVADNLGAQHLATLREVLNDPRTMEMLGASTRNLLRDRVRSIKGLEETKGDLLTGRTGRWYHNIAKRSMGIALKGVMQMPKQATVAISTYVGLGKDANLMWQSYADAAKAFTDQEGSWQYQLVKDEQIHERAKTLGGLEKLGDSIAKKAVIRGDEDDAMRVLKVLSHDWGVAVDKLLVPLSASDAISAQAAWFAFYKKKLKQKGVDLRTEGWKHEKDAEAAAYANQMTSRQQNANAVESMAQIYREKGSGRVIVDLLFSYSSFALNMKKRMARDIQTLRTGAKEDKAYAARDLAGMTLETMAFSAMTYWIAMLGKGLADKIADAVFGGDGDDDDLSTEEWLTDVLSKGAFELLFGGLPEVAANAIKTGINPAAEETAKLFGTKIRSNGQDLFYVPYGWGAGSGRYGAVIDELTHTAKGWGNIDRPEGATLGMLSLFSILGLSDQTFTRPVERELYKRLKKKPEDTSADAIMERRTKAFEKRLEEAGK